MPQKNGVHRSKACFASGYRQVTHTPHKHTERFTPYEREPSNCLSSWSINEYWRYSMQKRTRAKKLLFFEKILWDMNHSSSLYCFVYIIGYIIFIRLIFKQCHKKEVIPSPTTQCKNNKIYYNHEANQPKTSQKCTSEDSAQFCFRRCGVSPHHVSNYSNCICRQICGNTWEYCPPRIAFYSPLTGTL